MSNNAFSFRVIIHIFTCLTLDCMSLMKWIYNLKPLVESPLFSFSWPLTVGTICRRITV